MTKQELNEFMVKKCYKKFDFFCPSSFAEYNGKRYVNLKKFWKLLQNQGIKTYEKNREWFDVVLDTITERSLKQRLGFFVRYGTLNSPAYFRQAIECFNKYSANAIHFIEPTDADNCYDYSSYSFFDEDGNNITKDFFTFCEEHGNLFIQQQSDDIYTKTWHAYEELVGRIYPDYDDDDIHYHIFGY